MAFASRAAAAVMAMFFGAIDVHGGRDSGFASLEVHKAETQKSAGATVMVASTAAGVFMRGTASASHLKLLKAVGRLKRALLHSRDASRPVSATQSAPGGLKTRKDMQSEAAALLERDGGGSGTALLLTREDEVTSKESADATKEVAAVTATGARAKTRADDALAQDARDDLGDDEDPDLKKCDVLKGKEVIVKAFGKIRSCTQELKKLAMLTMRANRNGMAASDRYLRTFEKLLDLLKKLEAVHELDTAFNKDTVKVRNYLFSQAEDLKRPIQGLAGGRAATKIEAASATT